MRRTKASATCRRKFWVQDRDGSGCLGTGLHILTVLDTPRKEKHAPRGREATGREAEVNVHGFPPVCEHCLRSHGESNHPALPPAFWDGPLRPPLPLPRSLPFHKKGRGAALHLSTTGSQQRFSCRCQDVYGSPVLPGHPPLRFPKGLMGRAMEVMDRKLTSQVGCSTPPKTSKEKAGTTSASHRCCWSWLRWPQQESRFGIS